MTTVMTLHPGRRWIGRATDSTGRTLFDTLEVRSDTMIGTEQWYHARRSNHFMMMPPLRGTLMRVYDLLTNRADGLYTWSMKERAVPVLRKPVHPGDTIADLGTFETILGDGSRGIPYRVVIVAHDRGGNHRDTIVQVPVGTFLCFTGRYITIPLDNNGLVPLPADDSIRHHDVYIAPGFGPVKEEVYSLGEKTLKCIHATWELIALDL
jgi:hypothetical protein